MKKILILAISTIVCYSLSAQDDFDDFKADFDKFKEETEKEYDNFREQCNAEYAQFLKEAWEAFDRMPGVQKPKDQKRLPQDIIDKLEKGGQSKAAGTKGKASKKGVKISVDEVVEASQMTREVSRPEPVGGFMFFDKIVKKLKKAKDEILRAVRKEDRKELKQGFKPEARQEIKQEARQEIKQEAKQEVQVVQEETLEEDVADLPGELLTFEFYGTPMSIHTGPIKKKLTLASASNEAVGAAWETCSSPQYNVLIAECLELRNEYHLCDWAYLQMIKAMADAYLGTDTNESVFLTAFIYCQSGYQMRLAQSDGRLILLYATAHGIYDQSYYTIGGLRFYPFAQNGTPDRIQICNHAFPKEQAMSLLVPEEPMFAQVKPQVRTIESKAFPDMSITVSVNKNLLDFFTSYPTSNLNNDFLTRWAMYANTPLDDDVKAQVYPVLREKLKGLSESEAASKLLSLLQSGLVYRYDEDVWGEDRAFFAEETLFYPYADCEDRSILFSRLVRDVLGLKAVLIYYPNHLATAVHFNQTINGDYVLIGNERYMICDPTNYVAAPGVTMQGMDNATAKVIMLNN